MKKQILMVAVVALLVSGCGQDLPSKKDNVLVEKAKAALVCASFFNLLGQGSLYQYENFDNIKNYAMLGEESRFSLKDEAERTVGNVQQFVDIAKIYWVNAGNKGENFSSFVDDHVEEMQGSEIEELTSRFGARLSGEEFLQTYRKINDLAGNINCALTASGPFADVIK